MRALIPALVALASPLAAQEGPVANGSTIGNWVVQCEAVTVSETACRVQQSLSVAETGQMIATFVAVPRPGGAAVLVAQVPIGAHLPSGAVYRPDGVEGAEQVEMIWQRCLGPICEAAVEISAAELAGFTEAGAILFGYRMRADSDPIIVPVSVARLQEALAAISG